MSTIRRALAEVFRRQVAARAIRDVCVAVFAAAAAVALFGLLLGYWPGQPPAAVRWAILLSAGTAAAAGAGWAVRRTLLWRPREAQTARFVERACPALRNDLTNAVLLTSEGRGSEYLVTRCIDEAAANLRRTDIDRCVPRRSVRRWAVCAAVAIGVLAIVAVLQPQVLARGLQGVLAPAAYVPRINSIELAQLTPGDVTVFAGASVDVKARLAADVAGSPVGRVVFAEPEAPRPMAWDAETRTYSCRLPGRGQSYHYAVAIGSSRWPTDRPWYTVTVLRRVELESIDQTFTYPAYFGTPPRTITDAGGPIEGPVGATVTLRVRLGTPAPSADIEIRSPDGRKRTPMTRLPDGRTFETDVPLRAPGAYRILLKDHAGSIVQQFPPAGQRDTDGTFRIRAVADRPPELRFTAPAMDTTAAPGGRVKLRLAVGDDHAVTSVRFLATTPGGAFREISRVSGPLKGPGAPLEFELSLAAVDEGQTIEYYATATDNRHLPEMSLGPQTRRSGRFKVRAEDPAKAAAAREKHFRDLRERLLAILKMQQTQRVQTGLAREKHVALDRARAIGGQIVGGQTAIRTAVVGLAENTTFDPRTRMIQQVLAALAANETQTAIAQARVLEDVAGPQDRAPSCDALAATQDRILDTLHALLGMMPALKRDVAAARATGDDLPPDVQAKLRDLLKSLEAFRAEQRKVIEATRHLAKRPVDDFSPQDEELLKQLAATEDKWEKFLNEAFQDMSKIQEQDFTDPALLKELAAIKTDVTMAKDALANKAIDMATAAEENGYANSKEIEHNMEKWLPDEPDRKKWDMEDPENQQDMEMPELPTELEDMMGDLLEQEEDLFEAMQDTSSKHGGSIDSGWDAMDGPISTPNADGVTGNQLPNSNEMQGRSGEGRTGKASGEHVEDKAVGKGGRRTPSRLTPDTFQKGQVDDTSAEPPGGASGGGKLSGGGAEGLEGPVPAELKKQLKRLAGKQAQLLNRAERLKAKLEPGSYANFKFLQAITLMNRVRKDLEANRYRNALRGRRQTLDALRSAHDVLTGKVDVETDTSKSLPRHVRRNVADAMEGQLPADYRDALEQYYRRIGTDP